MKYTATVHLKAGDEHTANLQRGQWINHEGIQGRWIGRRNGIIWILWTWGGKGGTKRLSLITKAIKS